MLMLERAAETVNPSECNDPAVLLACSLGSDSCPAACRDNSDETVVDENGEKVIVKSGDLSVSAERNETSSVISSGATSELDTLTFQASEEITLKSVTLERFGYSTASSVASIWLEDLDGNKVTAEKSLSASKDTVTLSLKKDYQTIKDGDKLVVVMTTANAKASELGKSIGFKIIEVDASAKNLNVSNYSANLYDIIDYAGTNATVQLKGSAKQYNYEEGKIYEVAKVKVSASNSAIVVRGFTLNQTWTKTLDLDKFVDEVEISVDGKAINSKASVKRDELTVTFDDQEIAINKNSTFTVSVSLKDFDEFGSTVNLGFEDSSDITILESKNQVRISNNITAAGLFNGPTYVFNGGKINLTNVKLNSTIDAAEWSDDVVIAEGKITLGGQAVRINSLPLTPDGTASWYVESVKLSINGEEYEATKNNSWTVKNVVIEEDAKIKLLVDIKDNLGLTTSPTFTIKVNNGASVFSKSTLTMIKYDDISAGVANTALDNLVWSISVSTVKIQPAKGSLTNDSTKKVEFKVNETKDQVVFNGKYTAKNNGNVNLDNVKIWRVANASGTIETDLKAALTNSDVTFTIEIDGKAVATIDNPATGTVNNAKDDADFSPIAVKAWESVSVKITANVYADSVTTGWNLEYKVQLSGKDDSGNDAGFADKDLAPMAFVDNSSISIATNASMKQQDVVLANKNQNLATFIVKPANKATTANLDSFEFVLSGWLSGLNTTSLEADDYFEVKVGTEIVDNLSLAANTLRADDINIDITADTQVTVTFKEKLEASATGYVLTLNKVNDGNSLGNSYEYKRTAVNSLVRVRSMAGNKDSDTKYVFDIEYSDDANSETIKEVTFTYANDGSESKAAETWTNVQADKTYTTPNKKDHVFYVSQISWTDGDNQTVTLTYDQNKDFFKTNWSNEDRLRAYADD